MEVNIGGGIGGRLVTGYCRGVERKGKSEGTVVDGVVVDSAMGSLRGTGGACGGVLRFWVGFRGGTGSDRKIAWGMNNLGASLSNLGLVVVGAVVGGIGAVVDCMADGGFQGQGSGISSLGEASGRSVCWEVSPGADAAR
ncbi:hypothetical protein Tco_1369834 [Tanacetum coccineum]